MIDPYWESVSLLMNFNDQADLSQDFVDASKWARPAVANGAGCVINNTIKKFGTGSCHASGASSGVRIGGAHDSLNYLGTADFTIEAWIYGAAEPNPDGYWVAVGDASPSPDQFGWALGWRRTTNGLQLKASANGTSVINYIADLDTELGSIGPTGFYNSTFHHVHITRHHQNLIIGLDGLSSVDNAAFDMDVFNHPDQPLTIMGVANGAGISNSPVGNYMDSIRVTKGVARYTGATTYTAPTADFPTAGPAEAAQFIRRRRRQYGNQSSLRRR